MSFRLSSFVVLCVAVSILSGEAFAVANPCSDYQLSYPEFDSLKSGSSEGGLVSVQLCGKNLKYSISPNLACATNASGYEICVDGTFQTKGREVLVLKLFSSDGQIWARVSAAGGASFYSLPIEHLAP